MAPRAAAIAAALALSALSAAAAPAVRGTLEWPGR
jgi:Spy/CpxP family protein refolding chaperone